MLKIPATAVLITREAEYPPDVWPPAGVQFDEVLIETRCPGLWRRYELALQARNRHVYVQDDDHATDIPALWSHYDHRRLTNACPPAHRKKWQQTGHTLVGWGAFFPKRLIDFSRWTAAHGTLMRRNVFDAFGRQTDRCEDDRIFCWLARPHVNPVVLPIRSFKRSARLVDEPGALESRARCRRLLKRLG